MAQLICLNKPYGVLCQFSDNTGRPTLADHITTPDVYPAGRLDLDSEGLLLLTDNGQLQHKITDPKHKLPKTYWAQVEGIPSKEALSALKNGPTLNDGPTRPCRAKLITPDNLWERVPPIRERAAIPTQWIELTITEGRNRQVRRMTAAIGHPTLRLIRVSIGSWTLNNLQPGQSACETIHVEQTKPKTPRANKPNSKNRYSARNTTKTAGKRTK